MSQDQLTDREQELLRTTSPTGLVEPETFWDGFKFGWRFWTFWLRVKPSAAGLGGVAATILYIALFGLVVTGFWELVY